MWNGLFSPTFQKGLDPSDVSFLSDDGRTEDSLTYPDDEEVVGTMTVILNGVSYEWPNITFAGYSEFEASGFSRKWLNDNLDINYVGDWGWPWGRTKPGR